MGRLLAGRGWWGGGLVGLYGLWLAVRYLPAELTWGRWVLEAIWAIGVVAGAGAVAAAAVAALAALASRPFPRALRIPVAACVEAILWTLAVAWVLLNEFLYATTSQVLGSSALALLRHNTAAVLEGAWEMGAPYLIATAVLSAAAGIGLYCLCARSLRQARSDRGRSPCDRAGGEWRRRLQPVGGAAMILWTAVLVWQFAGTPARAFLDVCRTLPPLKALEITRILLGDPLQGPVPEQFGPPVISDAAYAATMGSPRDPAPNIVCILLESTPARALHCYGYPKSDITPHIDALAGQGVLFEHCVSPSSFSSASVASIMTSLDMLRGPAFDHFAHVTFPFMSLAQTLKHAGYELALFSSGNESFDNIHVFAPPELFDTYFSHDTCDIPKTDCMRMDDTFAVQAFTSWIRRRTDPRPFYVGFYLQSPHFNYEVPEPWAHYYQPVPPLYSNGDGILHIPPDVLPMLRNQYDNALRYADHWVGQIHDLLAETGRLDRTIIVLIGDHGEAFMQHGLARHGVATWEEMIHVPLIFYAGSEVRAYLSRPPGTRVKDTVSSLDLLPTVAALVGVTPHPSWQGVNVLDPAYTDRGRPIFSMTQYTRWQEAVCFNGYKYIYDLSDRIDYLFDLWADPGETRNLVSERPDLRDALRALLAGHHTYQLTYYKGLSASPPTHYVGRYQPDPALRKRLDVLTRR